MEASAIMLLRHNIARGTARGASFHVPQNNVQHTYFMIQISNCILHCEVKYLHMDNRGSEMLSFLACLYTMSSTVRSLYPLRVGKHNEIYLWPM